MLRRVDGVKYFECVNSINTMLSWKLLVFVIEFQGNRESQSMAMGNLSDLFRTETGERGYVERLCIQHILQLCFVFISWDFT